MREDYSFVRWEQSLSSASARFAPHMHVHLCICAGLCACVCMCVCARAGTCTCACACSCVRVCACTCTCACSCVRACTCACSCACSCVCACPCVCVRVRVGVNVQPTWHPWPRRGACTPLPWTSNSRLGLLSPRVLHGFSPRERLGQGRLMTWSLTRPLSSWVMLSVVTGLPRAGAVGCQRSVPLSGCPVGLRLQPAVREVRARPQHAPLLRAESPSVHLWGRVCSCRIDMAPFFAAPQK